MSKLVVKETVTKEREIEISFEALLSLIDDLTLKEMEKLFNNGFIDTFRHFNTEPHNYTWWSYRARAREKNLGWRIDYFAATKEMESRLTNARILPEAKHSDHCPIVLEID